MRYGLTIHFETDLPSPKMRPKAICSYIDQGLHYI